MSVYQIYICCFLTGCTCVIKSHLPVTLKSFNLLGTHSACICSMISLHLVETAFIRECIPWPRHHYCMKTLNKNYHRYITHLCTWCVPQCKSPGHNLTKGANVHACTCRSCHVYRPVVVDYDYVTAVTPHSVSSRKL